MCKFFLPQTIFAIFTYIHDNAQHTLHNLLPLQKTIDYCFRDGNTMETGYLRLRNECRAYHEQGVYY